MTTKLPLIYGPDKHVYARVINIMICIDERLFDLNITKQEHNPITPKTLRMLVTGTHNVRNAFAAITVAWALDVNEDTIRYGLRTFAGINRRFTTLGMTHGVRVIDDYTRNPVQIAATLSAVRQQFW